jgi:hypothetical protein
MTRGIERIDDALTQMASQAKEAREQWLKELAACRAKGFKGEPSSPLPLSLTERFAHWSMAYSMLHIAVAHLKNGGDRDGRTDRLAQELIEQAWPRPGQCPMPDGMAWACPELAAGLPCARGRAPQKNTS